MNKSIEIRTIDNCETCHTAIKELQPLAKQNNIPLFVRQAHDTDTLVPVICFIEDGKKTCFEGYSEDTKKICEMFIK